ncbi:MAG TPA: VOC family protein [Candidatus Sulfomarinibacteraceae bacterium]|nr:VOC family protein [Candidatus Sulfomarinibacteraceae bacterium]
MTDNNSQNGKIIPYLWFDDQAEEAIDFYVSAFNDARVGHLTRYGEAGPGPEGSVMIATFEVEGQPFMALNGGPQFKFTPAISFFINYATEEALDAVWQKLAEGGTELVPLGKYPFSDKFGWIQDKYGLTWQLHLAGEDYEGQKVMPFLLFAGEHHGKAAEAVDLYTSLFGDSNILTMLRYGAADEEQGEVEGTVQHARFALNGQEFMAMDSNKAHDFIFTEAISLYVNCETQEEVDAYWDALTDGGEEQPCGWLKDKYGVSWQIIPRRLGELMQDEDPQRAQRVTEAMLQMTKIDIAALERAYEQG